MLTSKRLFGYLATGVIPERTALDESLDEHDKKYHPNGYHDGDSCNKRDEMAKNDDPKIDPSQGADDYGKSIASKIEKAFEDAGLKGWGGVDVYVDGDDVQIEGGVDLPFGPVDYKLGKNRGYNDVWADESEISDYKSKFEDAVLGILDDEGIDYGFETLEWREENDGRGESGHKFLISGTRKS